MKKHQESSLTDNEVDFDLNGTSRASARTEPLHRTDRKREVTVAVPSNTATNNSITGVIKPLRHGIDSLYLSYQGNLSYETDKQLQALKQLAQSDSIEDQAQAKLKLGDHLFEVKDKGTSMFAYVLEDNAFRIQLSRPTKAVPMAYIKLSSEYLTYKSPAQAEAHLKAILQQLGDLDSEANVSRVDLFLDFVSDMDMESWTREAWVTRAAKINAYSIDTHFTGWSIGLGSAIAGRLYDKKYELLSSGKTYLVPLWKACGLEEGEPVWRLEFEFKRDLLDQKGIIPLDSVLKNLNGLWSYATTEWLRLTIPNEEDKTRSRWPIHPLWLSLSSVDWETDGGPLQPRFKYTRVPKDREAFKRAFSAITSWMAAHGITDYEQCIHSFYLEVEMFINNKAMDDGTTFEQFIHERVAHKARSFNIILDEELNIPLQTASEAEAYKKASDGE